MSGSCRRECDEYDFSQGMKIGGRKWELPIPKSKEYWKKFCDDEEKRLIIVRNPSPRLSYSSFPKDNLKPANFNSHINDKAYNQGSSFNSRLDDRKASDSSLHKLYPIKSKLKISKHHCDDTKLSLKPILKTPFRATPSTSPSTSSKTVRIPKFDTQNSHPSTSKIPPNKSDHVCATYSQQNETVPRGGSLSTLPSSNTSPPMSDPQLTLKKLRKLLRLPVEKNSKVKHQRRRNIVVEKDETPSTNHSLMPRVKEESKKTVTDEDSLKYSARFAYKALKHLTKNKSLDFKLKSSDRFQTDSFFKSYSDSLANVNEQEDLLDVKDTKGDVGKNSIDNSEFTDVEGASLKSDGTLSKTITTGSRSTSGPSPDFMEPEKWGNPSSRILSSIPKLSGFPRKNRDRCLPCMYKPFEIPIPRKISLPGTLLQRIIDSESIGLASPKDSSDSDSTSIGVPDFKEELERILNDEIETSDVTLEKECDVSKNEAATKVASGLPEKPEQLTGTTEQSSMPESESSRKAITKKVKGDQQDDDITSTNSNDPAVSSTQVTTQEGAKVPSSFQSGSWEEEEDDPTVVSIVDDQPKPKYLAACHAPTIFKPSLEPLKALRNRKPTTLQDRIALLESAALKKDTSMEDYEDIPEKSKTVSKEAPEENKTEKERKPPPPLTKAKSALEKLTVEKVEADMGKQRHVLRKGTSFSSFSVLTDTASNETEIFRDASEDTLRELEGSHDDGFVKAPRTSDFSTAQTKLPLTNPKEVIEFLENLGEDKLSTDVLDILCKEFSERLFRDTEKSNLDAKERNKIATLTRLLADSKRYLCPDKFPSDLFFSSNQPPPCNSRLLRRIFPVKSYNLVAPILGMPEQHAKIQSAADRAAKKEDLTEWAYATDETLSTSDTLEVHPPTLGDTETPSDKGKVGHRRYNPYALFLMKPRRKVVTWRSLTKRDLEGYDPDATLKMRADNSMKRICQDFCQWVESLGGTDNTIDEEVLRDMFEIDFSAEACRAMQVSIQEMPVVPAEVAITRNFPEASKLNMTKRHVMGDVKAEESPAKVKAFGTSLPWELRFVPPNNQVRKRWLQCDNVPRDLETMDVIWNGITHLKSVRGFVEWLQRHPEVPQPYALKKIASLDIRTLRMIEDDETFAHLELDVNQIKSLRVVI